MTWPTDLTLLRSTRKSVALQIKDGQILVRAPQRLATQRILSLIEHKLAWARQCSMQQSASMPPPIGPTSTVLWQGLPLELLDPKLPFDLSRYRPNHHSGAWLRARLIEQYRAHALDYFNDRSHYWADRYQVTLEDIKVRDYKARWGSCSRAGSLSFNWRLMMAPPVIADYVCVHEVCHRIHMDHSKSFWAEVERGMPDWKTHRKWLRDHGHQLLQQLPKYT